MRTAARRLSLILIFTIPWEGVIAFPGFGTVSRLLGLALAAFWGATVLITGRLRKPGVFHVAVLAFVVWNAVSVLWSLDASTTLAQATTWVQLLGLVFILWDLYDSHEAIAVGLQAYVLGAYVAMGSAISNFASGSTYYTHFDRFSAGDTNPDGFGFIVALGVPLAWYLAGHRDLLFIRSDALRSLLRLLNFAYIPAAFVGIALSGTRTASIVALVGMAYGMAQFTRLRLRDRLIVLLALAAIFVFLVPIVEPLRSFQRLGTTPTELTRGDLNGRLEQWREGLGAFAANPVLGVGSSMYRSINTLGKVAHNSYLSVLVELGIVGLILFAIPLGIAVKRTIEQPKWERAFWLTVLAAWAIGVSTLTWEHRKSTWLLLTLLVANAELLSRRAPVVEHREVPASTYAG